MSRMPAKGRSIASFAKPGVQRKIPESLKIICHDRHQKVESLAMAHKPSVIPLCPKNIGSLTEAISGIQDRVRLGAVLTT
jgi:hypothetical protein